MARYYRAAAQEFVLMNEQQRAIVILVAIIFLSFNLATYWWVNSFDSLASS